MSDLSSNDNSPVPATPSDCPDSHGQAAMLLVETLIHVLIAKSVLTTAEVAELIDDAADVASTIVDEQDDKSPAARRSVTLLMDISRSLKLDLPRS